MLYPEAQAMFDHKRAKLKLICLQFQVFKGYKIRWFLLDKRHDFVTQRGHFEVKMIVKMYSKLTV